MRIYIFGVLLKYIINDLLLHICDALRDLVPFVQSKKLEKPPWRSVNFKRVAGFKPSTLLKLTLLHECFSRFLNCTNGTKSCNASHLCNEHCVDNFFADAV